jgi:hypothetical protein
METARIIFVGVAMVAWASTGCAARRKTQTGPVTCTMLTNVGASLPVAERSLPASQWFSLLLYGYLPTGAITRPATDCSGRRTDWPADRCSVWPEPTVSQPSQSVTAADLVVENVGGPWRLIWAMTEHFADGQAQGPVALAQFEDQGVRVSSLGVLRAHPTRAKLGLKNFAGGTLLVAEGESCAVHQDQSTCSRTARLVPLADNRFAPLDLSDTAGKCSGSTLLLLKGQGTIVQGKGSGRKDFQFESALSFNADGLAIHEQLAVEEPARDGTSGTFIRRLQAERRVELRAGALLATAPSILDRWIGAQKADDQPTKTTARP